MDDELETLEAELKRLRPRPASVQLEQRIERQLRTPVGTFAGMDWRWALLPAAAAILVLLALSWTRVAPHRGNQVPAADSAANSAATEPAFKPVAVENFLYAARDEGLVTLDDGTTAVRQRLKYVDTITWRNPRTNASVRWSVPREEVRVVPVTFQ